MSETLVYVYVPRFYAEVERVADPALARRPVIVGGDPRKRGLVQAASEAALAEGVQVGMTVLEALERCPGARVLPTDMRRYREVSLRLRACFRRLTQRVEPVGMEAAYLDLPPAAGPPEPAALELQRLVREELGLPLRAGIAPVKFLARLAAEESGPDGLRRVPLAQVARFLQPLPVERLPGVGPKTLAALAGLSVRTVGDVVALGRAPLEEVLGNHGLAILAYAEGRDPSRLRPAPHARSLSQECTLPDDASDRVVLEAQLLALAQRLESALALEDLGARRITLKLRYADQEATTRSQTLPRLVRAAREIVVAAAELLGRTQAGERPVRRLGLALSAIEKAPAGDPQLPLFSSKC